MEQINKDEKFLKELSKLCNKYNLKNCIFAGENSEDKMMGFYCIEKIGKTTTGRDVIECSLLAARMYQSAREKIFYTLDRVSK
jgi:hypothetical protein